MTKAKLKIDGMHCTSCAMNIDFDLEDLGAIKKAQTNYASQECMVEFDENSIKMEKIIETIKATGYSAEVLE